MNDLRAAWIAGLLEGEGCFDINKGRPRVRLGMTDEDVVDRFATFVNLEWPPQGREKPIHPLLTPTRHQPVYVATLGGRRAALLMRMLQPLMGQRRQLRIISCLARTGHGA